VDGQLRPLGDARYLLSPGDLYALRQIPEIVEIGISALKIEGRYKDADYVALATRAYRKAVDDAWAGLPQTLNPAEEIELEQVYSRTPGPYFLTGTDHQAVVNGRSPRHRGVLVGRVVKVLPDSVLVEPSGVHRLAPLKAGDGLVFDAADWRSPEEPEEGGRVYGIEPRAGNLELRFGREAIAFDRIREGDLVWRSHDPDLDKLVRPLVEASSPVSKQPVTVVVHAVEGEPLRTVWRLGGHSGVQAAIGSATPLGRARNRAIDTKFVREQLGRLGNTPYELAKLELHVEGSPFGPASMLNEVRREAVQKLQRLQTSLVPTTLVHARTVLVEALAEIERPAPGEAPTPRLHLLVRTPEQLDAALGLAPASITLDYLDLYGLRPSVERVRVAGIEVRVASPRVLKPGEERIVDFLLRLGCPILVRSSGLLETLRDIEHPALIGDFSLNAANAISASLFLRDGLTRLTPTHDLNAAQVADLARSIGADRIEAVAYQHLPVFHTEHCVFCRFLSSGTSYKDCGRPCDVHRVELRDVAGRSHPVVADVGCRNTVFGAEAQEASAHLARWIEAGIRHFRLEFVHESSSEVTEISRSFAAALSGQLSFAALSQDLRRRAPRGTTQGSLFVPADYLSLPVLQ
jgi:putative protease